VLFGTAAAGRVGCTPVGDAGAGTGGRGAGVGTSLGVGGALATGATLGVEEPVGAPPEVLSMLTLAGTTGDDGGGWYMSHAPSASDGTATSATHPAMRGPDEPGPGGMC